MIGMAHVADGYPLYYDAVNEKGVGMAGLNFVGNAVYQKVEEGRENVAQYELCLLYTSLKILELCPECRTIRPMPRRT